MDNKVDNNNTSLTKDQKDLIDQVRKIFAQAYASSKEDFDDVDVKRVDTDDAFVQRFLDDKSGNVNEASQMLIEAMKWRKTSGVAHIKGTDFPQEFFTIAEVHPYVKTKFNKPTIYVRVEVHRPIPDWRPVVERFLLYMIEKTERKASECGTKVAVIFDCRNGNVLNAELDLDLFVVKTVLNNYPQMVEYIALYQLPWVLWAIFKVVQSWFPPQYKDIFIFPSNTQQMIDLIGEENLPDYLGGTCTEPWKNYEKGNPNLADVATKFGLKENAVKQFNSKYSKQLSKST